MIPHFETDEQNDNIRVNSHFGQNSPACLVPYRRDPVVPEEVEDDGLADGAAGPEPLEAGVTALVLGLNLSRGEYIAAMV